MNNNKKFLMIGAAFLTVNFLFSTHLFVTFSEMTAYAASKDSVEKIVDQLTRIEQKVDKLILGF